MKKLSLWMAALFLLCAAFAACGGGESAAEKWCKDSIRVACEKAGECDALNGKTVAQCIEETMALVNQCDGASWSCAAAESGAAACLDAVKAQSCADFNAHIKPQACNLCPED
jgi:hypothetical protein